MTVPSDDLLAALADTQVVIEALQAIKLARTRAPAQIGAVVAVLRDNDMAALAELIIGPLPFEDGPPYEGMLQ